METAEAMSEASEAVTEPQTVDDTENGAVPHRTVKSAEVRSPRRNRAVKSAVLPRKPKIHPVSICLDACKYPVLRNVAREFGWRVVGEDDMHNLFWSDLTVLPDRLGSLCGFQKTNHFPGMSEISRKDGLSRTLNRMARRFPQQFSFFPGSWTLPIDMPEFRATYRAGRRKGAPRPYFISKPTASSQGKGIFLFRSMDQIDTLEPQVVQHYLARPHLIDGFKYDLRIYLLVTSVAPLRMFIHKKGMARFATNKYVEPTESNFSDSFMHLTNYSLNKKNEDFVVNEGLDHQDTGSKRSLDAVWDVLRQEGANIDQIWDDIKDIFIKTVVAIQPSLAHAYRTCLPNDRAGRSCFEILGMDILIDADFKPWLIEVNHAPSFNIDSPLDSDIKHDLVRDTFRLSSITVDDRRRFMVEERRRHQQRMMPGYSHRDAMNAMAAGRDDERGRVEQWEADHLGETGFEMIYPPSDPEEVERYEAMMTEKGYTAGAGMFSSVVRRSTAMGTVQRRLEKEREEKAAARLLRGQTHTISVREVNLPRTAPAHATRSPDRKALRDEPRPPKPSHAPPRPKPIPQVAPPPPPRRALDPDARFGPETIFRQGPPLAESAPGDTAKIVARGRIVECCGIRAALQASLNDREREAIRTDGVPKAFLPYLQENRRLCRIRSGKVPGRRAAGRNKVSPSRIKVRRDGR